MVTNNSWILSFSVWSCEQELVRMKILGPYWPTGFKTLNLKKWALWVILKHDKVWELLLVGEITLWKILFFVFFFLISNCLDFLSLCCYCSSCFSSCAETINRNVMINGLYIQILLLMYWFMINMAQIEDMFMDFIPYTALSTFILTLSLFKKIFFFWIYLYKLVGNVLFSI